MSVVIRRWVLVTAAMVAATGCERVRDAFSAGEDKAAEAGSEAIAAPRLGELLGEARQVPVSAEALRVLANLWIDYTLIGLAAVEGDSLADSATVAAAAWPQIQQRIVDKFHKDLLETRIGGVDSATVDSAYGRGDLRLLDHILVEARAELAADARAAKRREIEAAQSELRRGAAFSEVAASRSDDATRERAGRLGVLGRGETVAEFEDVAWALEAGATSEIVESRFGFHLIRRPPLSEVREEFERGLVDRLVQRFDSVYLDSLASARDVEAVRDVAPLVREALARLAELADSRRKLATYRGGKFTLGDFVYWVNGFPRRVRGQLLSAPDSVVGAFVEDLARSKILLEEARELGLALDAAEWGEIRTAYLSQLGFLHTTVGIAPDRLAEAAPAPDQRLALMRQRVEEYLRGILSNGRPVVEPPIYLAFELRERMGWRLRPAGLAAALERARTVRAALPPAEQPPAQPGPGAGATGRPPQE